MDIEPVDLVGFEAVGPSSFNDTPEAGQDFGRQMWGKLIDHMTSKNLPLQRKMYGVSWPADDHVPPQQIHMFVGFERSSEDLSGLSDLKLEGGNYFQYKYKGPASKIDEGFKDAYTRALPESKLHGREGQHLEIYPADLNMDAPEIQFDILIPIEEDQA